MIDIERLTLNFEQTMNVAHTKRYNLQDNSVNERILIEGWLNITRYTEFLFLDQFLFIHISNKKKLKTK